MKDAGQNNEPGVRPMAKLFASEVAYGAPTKACRFMADMDSSRNYPAEKFYRDVKVLCTIGEAPPKCSVW